eukprot:6133263-Karenia_brevis.AAC.1
MLSKDLRVPANKPGKSAMSNAATGTLLNTTRKQRWVATLSTSVWNLRARTTSKDDPKSTSEKPRARDVPWEVIQKAAAGQWATILPARESARVQLDRTRA